MRPNRVQLAPACAFVLALATLVVAACHAGLRDAGPPSVLLITIDTLRADHLGSYGYRLPTSPNIDRLAERGVRFADCSVQRPKTWPSIASMMTGMYPHATGIRGFPPSPLAPSFHVLAESFQQAGYATAAIVTNFTIGRRFGYDQGFDYFYDFREKWEADPLRAQRQFDPVAGKHFTNAARATDRALDWLRSERSGRPLFMWLHYMDPHGPYLPPPEYRDLFAASHAHEPTPLSNLPKYQLQSDADTGRPITDLGFYRAQYDREIRYVDREIGRLIEALGDMEFADRMIIALTADHGESLGDHEYYLEHGRYSYQATVHVPLILVQDGVLDAGHVVDEPVGLISLSATLLELAGLAVPPSFQAGSLAGLATGTPRDEEAPGDVHLESGHDTSRPQLVLRRANWKLIHVASPRDRAHMTGDEFELYDLETDPAETRNVAGRHPALVREMYGDLRAWSATGFGEDGRTGGVTPQLDERSREMLEALGYVDDGREPSSD